MANVHRSGLSTFCIAACRQVRVAELLETSKGLSELKVTEANAKGAANRERVEGDKSVNVRCIMHFVRVQVARCGVSVLPQVSQAKWRSQTCWHSKWTAQVIAIMKYVDHKSASTISMNARGPMIDGIRREIGTHNQRGMNLQNVNVTTNVYTNRCTKALTEFPNNAQFINLQNANHHFSLFDFFKFNVLSSINMTHQSDCILRQHGSISTLDESHCILYRLRLADNGHIDGDPQCWSSAQWQQGQHWR